MTGIGDYYASTLRARFEARALPEPNSGCWLWTGVWRTMMHGPPRPMMRHQGRPQAAYRIAYELYHGPIPKGLFVCHRCDVSVCVNPDHLFIGTARDNICDAARKGRLPQSKLSLANVREIRATKGHNKELARRFGVAVRQIGLVRQRKTWAHV